MSKLMSELTPEQAERVRASKRKYSSNKYKEFRAKGLCTVCGDTVFEDKTRCKKHHLKHLEASYRYSKTPKGRLAIQQVALRQLQVRRKEGRCNSCGRPLLDGGSTLTSCAVCADRKYYFKIMKRNLF